MAMDREALVPQSKPRSPMSVYQDGSSLAIPSMGGRLSPWAVGLPCGHVRGPRGPASAPTDALRRRRLRRRARGLEGQRIAPPALPRASPLAGLGNVWVWIGFPGLHPGLDECRPP